ncbi:MAG: nicotinate-nucleotide diphosphorylase (carboxylating) [Deltaproteobacteria bacterium]|jgi:nicotinate-nucleotide pyrophosphorylase (carboxylating)|nr:nicotinate-nucleotide diphosphorylase (carboxylating) [Deltaproteobacteria bacterium]
MPVPLSPSEPALAPPATDRWRPLVELALAEDIGTGDLTSLLTIEAARTGRARVEARAPMTVCGLPIVREVFERVDEGLSVRDQETVWDGVRVEPGQVLLRVAGSYASILTAERTALNFLGRLCGIATQTRRLVDLVADLPVDLVDTRKTTPGWRILEKYAVAVGGGMNHRIGLYDAVLVKDNHIAAAGGFDTAVQRALRKAPPGVPVQVEVESLAMADRAVELGCRFLLLDNLEPAAVRQIVDRHAPDVVLEASGGIGPGNLRAYAETGIARISMGALTHSVISADVALEVDLLDAASAEPDAPGDGSAGA